MMKYNLSQDRFIDSIESDFCGKCGSRASAALALPLPDDVSRSRNDNPNDDHRVVVLLGLRSLSLVVRAALNVAEDDVLVDSSGRNRGLD